MEITLEYDDPSKVYLEGYKTYFYSNYKKEITINLIIIAVSLIMIATESVIILAYMLSAFSTLYVAVIWLFYYTSPISTIKRRKGSSLKIYINSDEISTIGDEAEIKLKWGAIRKSFICKNFIILFTKYNSMIILEKESFDIKEFEWILNLLDGFKLNIRL